LPPAVHIAPGSLPKGLHSIDLSRNKIATVEGLRDLTKLRVLNLSYNRISRIGHGMFLHNTSYICFPLHIISSFSSPPDQS
jgi:hypothetical protein